MVLQKGAERAVSRCRVRYIHIMYTVNSRIVLRPSLHVERDACRFNSTVFANRLPADLEIAWSAHLKTTAGTTHFRREPSSLPFAGPRYIQSQQAFQCCMHHAKGVATIICQA